MSDEIPEITVDIGGMNGNRYLRRAAAKLAEAEAERDRLREENKQYHARAMAELEHGLKYPPSMAEPDTGAKQ